MQHDKLQRTERREKSKRVAGKTNPALEFARENVECVNREVLNVMSINVTT